MVQPEDDEGVEVKQTVSQTLLPAQWWWAYMDALGAALEREPCQQTIDRFPESKEAEEAVRKGKGCITCGASAFLDLCAFTQLLAQKIDESLTPVSVCALLFTCVAYRF